jgi:hypothetical protein
MDYGAVAVFERLTGRAFFTPAGQTGAINLGNILTHKLEWGLKRKTTFKSRRGQLSVRDDDVIGAEPRFTIECDEFATPLLALLHGGSAPEYAVDTAATGATFTFTAALGLAFRTNFFSISNVSIVTPTGKVEGTDYKIDYGLGIIYLPLTSTIAPGATVTMRYDRIAITYNRVTALDAPSKKGTLLVYEEDDFSLTPKTTYACAVALSIDGSLSTKVDTYKSVTLRAAVLGSITIYKRDTEMTGGVEMWDELTLDDDSILDFS